MKKATRILALVLCAVMCLGLFVGCGNKGKQNSDTPLVVGYSPFNSKFSPFFSETAYDQDVWTMTAIDLLYSDRQGSIIMNGIKGETKSYNGTDYTYYGPADCEIKENADGTVDYNFKMREDLKFSDGEPITIDDVIFSMYVLCDPSYDGNSTLFAVPIQGMDAYRSGMDTLFNLIYAAGRDNTNFSDDPTKGWTKEQQDAYWADVDQAADKFVQEIMDSCIAEGANAEGDSVAACLKNWGFELPEDATKADAFAAIVAASMLAVLFLTPHANYEIWSKMRSTVFPLTVIGVQLIPLVPISDIALTVMESGELLYDAVFAIGCITLMKRTFVDPRLIVAKGLLLKSLGMALGIAWASFFYIEAVPFSAMETQVSFAVVITLLLTIATFWVGSDDRIRKIWGLRKKLTPKQYNDAVLALKCEALSQQFRLTARESETLLLLAQGRRASEIKEEKHLSINTVRSHIQRLYTKLDVHSIDSLNELIKHGEVDEKRIG